MAFHVNNSGYVEGAKPRPRTAKTGGCACGCDTRGPDPEKGGDLVQVARALAVASKVDQALERHAPITTNATASKPLTPRGILSGKPHSGAEKATQGRDKAQGQAPAKATTKATASASLRPRGLLNKGSN